MEAIIKEDFKALVQGYTRIKFQNAVFLEKMCAKYFKTWC